jgi:phosphate-selective porin OprO and OprP
MTRILTALVLGLCLSTPAAAQEIKFAWTDHPTVRAGKWLRIDFRARVQNDVRRSALDDTREEPDDTDIARRRVGIEGRIGGTVEYQVEYEIGAREWRDVYVDYRQFKPVQVQAGAFKVPFGLEETTSATKLDFIYRSRISSRLAPGRDRGVAVHGKVFKSRVAYEAGMFSRDGDNALPSKNTRVGGGRMAAARFVVQPFRTSTRSAIATLQLGVATTTATVPAGLPGVRARTVFGASFFDSDIWVQGRRQRTGLEAQWRPGPFSVQAEYIRLSDERRGQAIDDGDLSPLVAQGWYVSGTYRRGRIEAASRFETLKFGDTSGHPDASTSTRAELVLGNFDRAVTFGVNYHVNRWIKVQANLIREQLHDASMGPLPDRPNFWSRALRIQVTI